MSITRIIIVTLLICGSLLMYVLFNLESNSGDSEYDDVSVLENQDPSSEPKTASPETAPDAADSSENDEQADKEQLEAALSHIKSTKHEERMEAAEQLGAFPSPEMETVLTDLLTKDTDAGVRNAAALSLSSLDAPTDATTNGLLSALEDTDEEVRLSALSTLENYLLGLEQTSTIYHKVKAGLVARADSKTLSPRIRDLIVEVLRNQQTQDVAIPDS